MKRIISKLMIASLIAFFTCTSLFAASAKVTYVKGKVEISRGNEWVALKVGDLVNEAETISTGFQSEARLNYNGSVMAVPALSRITLETLQSSGSKDLVSLKIDTGAVRSKVTHTEGKRIEYTARTPVGVASVRGTDFTVFSNGKAKVFEGAIAYYKVSDYVAPQVSSSAEEEEEDSEPAADTGSATATTAASEIADSSPKGAMVVGAGQTSTINKAGLASKPITEAKQRTSKVKATVASAATKEVLAASLASAAADAGVAVPPAEEVVVMPERKTTATVNVTIKIDKD